jgi:hypothetical protein
MPKPLKKSAKPKKKSTTPKRSSSDPNRRAKQMLDEHMAKAAQGQPPWAKDFAPAGMTVTFGPEVEHEVQATPSDLEKFDAMYRAKMAALGAKGGKKSGAKRMDMPVEMRRMIASNAARARWAKRATKKR